MKTKKIKQVFSSANEVCKIFASQSQGYGCAKYVPRNGGPRSESIYFQGENLYSFGPHYLLARTGLIVNGVSLAVVNFTQWSRTTGDHSNYAYNTLRYSNQVVLKIRETDTNIMRGNPSDTEIVNAALDSLKRDAENFKARLESIQSTPENKYSIQHLKIDILSHNEKMKILGLDYLIILDYRPALARGFLLARLNLRAYLDHAKRVQLRLDCFNAYPFNAYSFYKKDHKRTA